MTPDEEEELREWIIERNTQEQRLLRAVRDLQQRVHVLEEANAEREEPTS